MTAVDPTYPLYPIACFIAAAMLLLVLLTIIVRQNWNLGVAFLCFWPFWENLTLGISAIVWSDNADVKLYAFCDFGGCNLYARCVRCLRGTATHVQLVSTTVKPMATLIIARRLYLITRLQSIYFPDNATVRSEEQKYEGLS